MARRITTLTVSRTVALTPHLVRVYLGDPDFDQFESIADTDAYVKLHFGAADDPTLRTYTVRAVDPVKREIAIDFVVHGDEGIAGPWAASVKPGTQIRMFGPGGGYRPRKDADWHLLAGDESAVPAISAAIEALPAGVKAFAVIEVADASDEMTFSTRADLSVKWVHRGAAANEIGDDRAGGNSPLVDAVRAVPWLPGDVQVFIHGEALTVMKSLRPYVRKERGVPASWASISGYWRRGHSEESFRQWKRGLADQETPSATGWIRRVIDGRIRKP